VALGGQNAFEGGGKARVVLDDEDLGWRHAHGYIRPR
jgi:hypothetical protein